MAQRTAGVPKGAQVVIDTQFVDVSSATYVDTSGYGGDSGGDYGGDYGGDC